MKAIVHLYWQICLMRVSPDQVPAAATLMGLTFLAYSATFFIARLGFDELSLTFTAISYIVITLFWATMIYAVLMFKGVAGRFQQTFTAVLGTDVLLSLFLVPLSEIGSGFPPQSPGATLFGVLVLLVLIWDVLVKGFIFRHAFNVTPLLGNLFSLMLSFLIMMLAQALLMEFEPQALEAMKGNG